MGDAVQVEALGKRYRLGELGAGTSLREAIVAWLRPRHRATHDLWALRDVSFTLEAGRTLGVVGRNGSGKSTLLKVLARITEPTEGVARTRGRVASLLEVGTGFHEELTGRDNIHLNGAIHGMTRRDVRARFDDIVDFSGVGRFLDTPIKRYSTGMQLRLAFAVAAHLEPDLLLVDEVLAVGDLEFQRRCMARMQQVEREGRTVVFVSHDLAAVTRLCPRALWLEDGRVRADDETGRVLDAYAATTLAPPITGGAGGIPAGPIVVRAVTARDPQGHALYSQLRDRPVELEVCFDLREASPALDLALYLTNSDGTRVLDEAWSDRDHEPLHPGRWVARLTIPPILQAGEYRVGLWVGTQYEDHLDHPAVARVTLQGNMRRPHRVVQLDLPWTVEPRDARVEAP